MKPSHVRKRSSRPVCLAALIAFGGGGPGLFPGRPALAGDRPMWGGRPDRNMVSDETGLPADWDISTKRNIRWVAALGSRTYGNPVIAGGKVFIGTNNEKARNPKIAGDNGVLMCFAESDGRFLWQSAHDKLAEAQERDWPEIGVCSTPSIAGDRLYYVSNRGELVCLDTEGFLDGENDGPILNERHRDPIDADFVWTLDMIRELGVVPHHASASPPLVVEDIVFVVTGNGNDADHERVPAPDAPSFIAVDRATGKLLWRDSSPGANILDGQWSGPAYGVVNGQPQVVFPGGDGWLYAFEPKTGKPIWRFNGNAANAGDKCNLLATPVIHDNKVFIGIGQDPENGDGPGSLWAIDATKTGDVTATADLWRYGGKDFARTISTVAVRDGLLYAVELRGFLHCLDATTGRPLWKHDLKAPVWASPMVADGKVYIGNEDGDISVFRHGREKKLLAANAMKETVYSTVTPANGTLYVADRTHLYAIAAPEAAGTQPAATSRAASGDWPMFRGNPQLTGVAESALPADLPVLWKFGTPDAVQSSAAIANGVTYFGCDDGYLYALSLDNGAVRWKYKAGSGIRSSPCAYNGAVLCGDDDGVFHSVDAADGRSRWTFRTDGEIVSSATPAGDRVLFGSYDGHLYCLHAADGKLLWKFETEGRVHGTPGIANGCALIAGCDEKLRVVRLADGSEVRAVNMNAFSGASAAIRGPRVYVGTFGNQVLGIDWQKAAVAWTYEAADSRLPYYASAAVTDAQVVIGSRDKLVHAIDAATGKVQWTFATQGRVDSSPVIADTRVFVGSSDGAIYGLRLTDGKQVWRFDAGSAVLASPAVGRGRLVVGTEGGVVYCFGAKGTAK